MIVNNIRKIGKFIKSDTPNAEICCIASGQIVGLFWINHDKEYKEDGKAMNGYTLGKSEYELTYEEAIGLKQQLESVK